MLMQMIGANRGVMFSDQPLGLYSISSAGINCLPLFAYSQIACPDIDEQAMLRRYLQRLIRGEIRVNSPWKIWNRDFHFFNDRICLKITDAKAAIDWIDEEITPHVVVLTRHPIAQALSVSDKGWLMTGKGLLKNAAFVKRWMSDELVEECWRIYQQGTEIEWRVVDWAIENLVPIRLLPERPNWLYISYEDLMLHTSAVIDFLAKELELDDRAAMTHQIARPSRSSAVSSKERNQMIQQGDRDRLVNAWRARVSEDQLSTCFRLLDLFEIDLYRPDCSLPDHQQLRRGGFA